MKKIVYIILFTFLGILVQFLVHAVFEMWYVARLVVNFPAYGLGFSWEEWVTIHSVLSWILFAIGGYIGYQEGVIWWEYLYEKHPQKPKKKSKKVIA
ncbi:MAG: hypothetical protein COU90_04380 [Candidatus Ryanbacteria bacterium CG10_big_fil_rev_8_21_14_0_10_43_42]|uniref:Uncharacterized protein n=1 Tax=Candidatus Ryanbacteria bacterium CG10_big_fil_rev_8_21_14_0_10_43_42 TaxID=1974864 RepID=A0A2M8KVX5_9BACT|nr:MAG: hypothetical protein COU90_04380 [Candidatus Ryanbacteria bacterium CG10_big_fil_rev_8_21_14_0_10_43_42]